jgi:MSHA biogenesis protein MshN
VRPAAVQPAPASAGPETAPGKAHAKDGKTGHRNRHDDRFGGAGARAKSVTPLEPDSTEARALRHALAQELDARKAAASAAKPRKGGAAPRNAVADEMQSDKAMTASSGRQESAGQRAESQYRRALASMQEGRLTETVAALEAALHIDPGHEAARQTLVGLLVEAGRFDEAMRQLQLGLSLDPRQPALAMLLARLQIERGESGLQNGIDTLMRTLPFAGNDPDYRAVLAGALQRQGRHREAAEQYAQALRGAGKAVWWMGMGISLQADKRNGEALDAFRKARGAGLPSAELQAFVERRIQQLER